MMLQPKVVHLTLIGYGPSVVLTTGEQMRFASEDELLAAHCVPHYAVANLQLRGAKSFIDARILGFQPRQDQQSSSASKPPTTSPSINPQPTSQQHQQPAQTLAPVPEDAALMTWTRRMNLTVMLNVWVKHKLLKFHIFPKFLLVHKFHVLLLHYQVLDTKDKSLWQSLSHNQRTCQLQGLHNLPLERPCRQQCSSLIGLGPMLRMTPHGMTTALGFEATLQRLRLNGLRDDDDAMDIDEDNFEEQFAPHTAFMTGKAVCSKINLKNLSEKDLSLFQASMQKEWLSWQKFQAVQELSEEEVKPFLATPRSLALAGPTQTKTANQG